MLTEFVQVESAQQILTGIYGILLGILLCLFYDINRGLRVYIKPGIIALAIWDILFSLFSTIVVFCFLQVRCMGELRIFALIAMLMGWCFARLTISSKFYKMILAVISTILKIVKWLCKPLHALYHRRLKIMFQKIVHVIETFIKKIHPKAKKVPPQNP